MNPGGVVHRGDACAVLPQDRIVREKREYRKLPRVCTLNHLRHPVITFGGPQAA